MYAATILIATILSMAEDINAGVQKDLGGILISNKVAKTSMSAKSQRHTNAKHQRVRILSKAELAKATNNCNQTNLLGIGGFASVYKGLLLLTDENTTATQQIAVKKPKLDAAMAKQKHPNQPPAIPRRNRHCFTGQSQERGQTLGRMS
ncbi:Tyrosine-protein kinase [Trema orientale]|uniref:Tyrosine-protein kinase n=1 Tax=Trema orientale TaxID=63057 RepID=A0A2P5BPP2_TREOI|nr:Tyrosine-protein kinase [Trema orientale]